MTVVEEIQALKVAADEVLIIRTSQEASEDYLTGLAAELVRIGLEDRATIISDDSAEFAVVKK